MAENLAVHKARRNGSAVYLDERAIPLGFSISASLLLLLGPVPLVTFPAGYYKRYDLFKPGCISSLVWVAVMAVVMLGIAVPIGLI